MKALVYNKKNKITLEDLPIPDYSEDEALIKVYSAPICGTDLKIIGNGHFKIPESEDRILGHEVCGKVVKIGKNVTKLKINNIVSMAPNVGCGFCYECVAGRTQYCKDYKAIGITLNGAFSEYMTVPKQFIDQGNIYIFPGNIDITYDECSLTEILSTVLSGAEECKIRYSDIVLISGAGPIGIVHTMLARISGAQKVIVSEPVEKRREQAKKFGADALLDPSESNFTDKLNELTYGRGPDVIIIAAPSPKAQEASLGIINRGGRINYFGGLPKGNEFIKINSNIIHYNNITIIGTTGSSVSQYRRAVELVIYKKIPIKKIISKKFKLEEYEKAFEEASSGDNLKIIFNPNN